MINVCSVVIVNIKNNYNIAMNVSLDKYSAGMMETFVL